MHVDDWLDEEPKDENERYAKEWIEKFRMPAYDKHRNNREGGSIQEWLDARTLTCMWKGRRIQCSGASRMGDVWLREPGSQQFYDHRVNVSELSDWRRSDAEEEEDAIIEMPCQMGPHGDEVRG